MAAPQLGELSMGILTFKTAEIDVLQLECDDSGHEDSSKRKAWFSCDSYSNSLHLAVVSGWIERKGAWIRPQCAGRATKVVPAQKTVTHSSRLKRSSGRSR